MKTRVPLSTLLSQALVAFTIEFDNEAEHRMPHRTTAHGRSSGEGPAPWLVSMVMALNCMRYVDEPGIRLGELRRLARTETNLNGMQRWGYISIAPVEEDPRPKPPKKDWVVRTKPGGRLVQRVWKPLFREIEGRWRERFGAPAIEGLRSGLEGVAAGLSPELPDCLPIVGYGLWSAGATEKERRARRAVAADGEGAANVGKLALPVLLARVLLALAIAFEREAEVSLAISANTLRVLDEKPVAIRELPGLTGISTELTAVATGWLARHGFAVVAAAVPPERGQQIRLTEKGLVAQARYGELVREIEDRWSGNSALYINKILNILESIVKDGTATHSPLFAGLKPYPEGWRAKVRGEGLLPHFPVVSHRGGYPDGS